MTARRPITPTPPCSRRGFTIIEVLATLTLVGVVLPVAVDGILMSLATAGYARNQVRAASLAHSIMAEMVAGDDRQDIRDSGRFEPDGPDYHWEARWAAWEGDLQLVELTVTVAWTQRGDQRETTLSTLTYTRGER